MPRSIQVALVAFVLASGCRSVSPTEDAPILRVGVGVGGTARGTSVQMLREALYAEPLVGGDTHGKPTPSLAEKWNWEPGRRGLRFKLRRGVRFHDGSELTADTVRRSLQDQLKRRTGELGFANVVDITAPAPDELLIHLSQPDNFLVSALSGVRVTHPDAPQIGTGPFVLTNAEPVVETRRFEHYHQGRSALGGVTIRPYDTSRSAVGALMRGEVDAVQEVNREMVPFIAGNTNVRPFSSIQPFYVAMILNQRNPALSNAEVRRALSEAVDRAAIIERVMNGLGEAADGPVWPKHWAYSPGAGRPVYDPGSARSRLDRAGLRLSTNRSGLRTRFSFKCLVWNEDPMYERIALLIQRQLFEVGVDMVLQPVTLETVTTERMPAGNYDAFLLRFNASRSLEVTYSYWRADTATGKAPLNSGYSGANSAFDRLRTATTDPEMVSAVTELRQRFYEDVPAVFIAWLKVTRAVTNNFSIGDTEDPFAHLWRWKPVSHTRP